MPACLWTYSYRLTFAVLMAVICLSVRQAEASAQTLSCLKAHSFRPAQKPITNLPLLSEAMTKGMLLAESQSDVFGVYLRLSFGDPKTSLSGYNLKSVMDILKQHPELEKPIFREYEISSVQKVYASTQPLQNYIKSQIESAAQVRNVLFQIDANLGTWKKIIDFPELSIPIELQKPPGREASDAEKNAYKIIRDEFREKERQHQSRFQNFLNRVISRKNRDLLANLKEETIPYQEKAKLLFETLKYLQEWMDHHGRNTQTIRQAMLDLVHTIGFANTATQELLKSQDGSDQIEGLRWLLSERDTFAFDIGYQGHFEEILQKLRIDHPTGLSKNEDPDTRLQSFEVEVLSGPYTTKATSTTRVRSLSIQESPFRSCLGGDCSSRTYFSKALDPNFIYFTKTDEAHHSSGHLTLVLGEAKNPQTGKPEKIAFADKLQNIPNAEILDFLYAVSLSLAEKGYKLGIPEDVGGINGLSNMLTTRDFIGQEVLPRLSQKLTSFSPHPHKYNFPNQYSRAYNRLAIRIFDLETPVSDSEIRPSQIHSPFKADPSLHIEQLLTEVLKLRDSDQAEDVQKFISSADFIIQYDLYAKELFLRDLQKIAGDSNRDLRLRRRALYTEAFVSQRMNSVYEYASQLSDVELSQLISEISGFQKSSNPTLKFIAQKFNLWPMIQSGHRDLVKRLLKYSHFIDWDELARNGKTLLELAIEYNEEKVLKLLLQNPDTNVNAPLANNRNGIYALTLALKMREQSIIEILLNHPNIRIDANSFSIVVESHNEKLIERLLSHPNMDANRLLTEFSNVTVSALELLASRLSRDPEDAFAAKYFDIVLNRPDIDPNEKTRKGPTLLLWAIKNHVPFVVDRLQQHPLVIARINLPGDSILLEALRSNGETSGGHEAYKERSIKILRLLLNNPNIHVGQLHNSLRFINNSLWLKIVLGDPNPDAIAKIILSHPKFGYDSLGVSAQDTLLKWTVYHNEMEIFERLLRNQNLNVNAKNFSGESTLLWALTKHHWKYFERLLDHPNIDVNARGVNRSTALMHAARFEKPEIVLRLLNHPQIHINAQNDDGKTALSIAIDSGRKDIADLLRAHGAK